MTRQQHDALLQTLQARFHQHPQRHPGLAWDGIQRRPLASVQALQVLARMEASGGEPDVIGHDQANGQILFCDRRYGRVFTYHNGAESYYAALGFRGLLRV